MEPDSSLPKTFLTCGAITLCFYCGKHFEFTNYLLSDNLYFTMDDSDDPDAQSEAQQDAQSEAQPETQSEAQSEDALLSSRRGMQKYQRFLSNVEMLLQVENVQIWT